MQNRSRILFYGKLGVSLGLIGYLIWAVDWRQAIETIGQANKLLIAISPFFWLLSLVAGSLRWRYALADSHVELPLRQAGTGYLLGSFYNIFLPGVVGGDAIRIGLCVRETQCEVGTATAGVLLERISGVLALLSFFVSVSIFFPEIPARLVPEEVALLLVLLATSGIAAVVLVFLTRRTWAKWVPREKSGRVWAFLQSGIRALDALSGRTLGLTFLLSAAFQGARIGGMSVLSRAIGLDLPLEVFFVIIPMVYLVTLLPISLGGLGVREGTLVFLLAQLGVSTSDAIMFSFLVYLNQVFLGILGGFVQLFRIISDRKADGMADSTNAIRIANR